MKNDWQAKFGRKRSAIDRKLLADCERQIAREERLIPDTINPMPPTGFNNMRAAIARAFGRPIA